ncbi:MAG: glycosyltransferase, partial [Saprospiraceae bacterium]
INEFIDYKEIHTLYSQNDVIVLPYKQVTQCGPLLIAYSENIPVICNRLEGFTEYVDDGSSGFLFDETAKSLSERMEMIIDNPSLIKDMNEYIRINSFQKFSIASLSQEYLYNLK